MTSLVSVNCIVAGGNNMWVPGDSPSKVCNSIFFKLSKRSTEIFLGFLCFLVYSLLKHMYYAL